MPLLSSRLVNIKGKMWEKSLSHCWLEQILVFLEKKKFGSVDKSSKSVRGLNKITSNVDITQCSIEFIMALLLAAPNKKNFLQKGNQ